MGTFIKVTVYNLKRRFPQKKKFAIKKKFKKKSQPHNLTNSKTHTLERKTHIALLLLYMGSQVQHLIYNHMFSKNKETFFHKTHVSGL